MNYFDALRVGYEALCVNGLYLFGVSVLFLFLSVIAVVIRKKEI